MLDAWLHVLSLMMVCSDVSSELGPRFILLHFSILILLLLFLTDYLTMNMQMTEKRKKMIEDECRKGIEILPR